MTNSSIALITGGSRGLGKNMALHLAERGVDIILTYKSDEAAAHAVAAQIEKLGRSAVAIRLDAGDAATFPAFVERVASELRTRWKRDRFDYLVNNAGFGSNAPLGEITEEQFDELFRVHLKAPMFLTQRLLPHLADGGRILNISTGLTRFSFPGSAAYAAMKGGVEVLTRYMARELGARKITVNTLAPGAIETDFGGGHVRDNKQLNAMVASMSALGRAGLPDDIGSAVSMLLSPDSAWITGQRIEASGGMLL